VRWEEAGKTDVGLLHQGEFASVIVFFIVQHLRLQQLFLVRHETRLIQKVPRRSPILLR
jgi:hypothetical protein